MRARMRSGLCAARVMRARRFRYLITFVAAMFIANNAAASVYACLAGLGDMAALATTQAHSAMGHQEQAAGTDALCLTQCAQSYRNPVQEFAAAGSDFVSIPALSGPCLSVKTEPTPTRIAWVPPAAGPKLFLLFSNLRN